MHRFLVPLLSALFCGGGLLSAAAAEPQPAKIQPVKAPPAKPQPSTASPQAGSPTPAGVVYLERTSDGTLKAGKSQESRLLVRELLRQGLLIAARDELGLLTRDYWAGELMPESGGPAPLDLAVQPGQPNQIQLCRGMGAGRQIVGRCELSLPHGIAYDELLPQVEALSRTKFVELLKQAGFQGHAQPWNAQAVLPEE